jgi:methionyl-tRNA formyltransferase
MKYLFFGTPNFAAIILEKLIEAGFIPQAIVCNPDKAAGRKRIITSPPVKLLIIERVTHNVPVLQSEKLDKDFMLHVSSFKPDLFIVAAYSQIIPKEILEIPRLGVIGVHPSLLPKYRGASPIQSAILNGDKETGVSLYLMDEKIDHGPILAQQELEIHNTDYLLLSTKLAELGAELLIKYIKDKITPLPRNVQQDALQGLPQDESQATYTKKFKTEDAYIEPADLEKAEQEGGKIALEIDRKIRALNPEPGTWTMKNSKRMKILEAKLIDGKLKITKIQFEGKKPQIL